MDTIFDLAEGIRRCTACPLWKNRTLAVPGEGPANAKIMFVGESPGNEEDRQGLPFIGRSGKFLDEMLEIAGIKRKDAFITGAVKCHPHKNHNPSTKELKICNELWLSKQIEIIKPKLIVVLGRIALQPLLNKKSIKEIHGETIKHNKQQHFITYHPASGMRFPHIRKKMKKDFMELKALVKNL